MSKLKEYQKNNLLLLIEQDTIPAIQDELIDSNLSDDEKDELFNKCVDFVISELKTNKK